MTDDPLTDCPACHGSVRRVVNSVGVVFKGKGFYITDNRGGKNATLKPNGKDSAGSESGHDSATDSSATASTGETKSESPKAEATP